MVLLCASLLIQIESLMFWLPLEIYQEETLGHPTFVIALRAKNILAFALGKMGAWGLNNESDDAGSVGLRAHHVLEFSAVPAAARWRGAGVGRAHGICGMVCGAGGAGSNAGAASRACAAIARCPSLNGQQTG